MGQTFLGFCLNPEYTKGSPVWECLIVCVCVCCVCCVRVWVFESIPRDHLFESVPLGTRGEHSESSWQAERRKHQVGRFLQILEQLPAKFVHTLCHQQRRWQCVCIIIVGHHFCHLLRSWNLGTIFVWNFAGCVIIKVFMLFWSLLIAFNLNEEVFCSTYLAAIERVMTEI